MAGDKVGPGQPNTVEQILQVLLPLTSMQDILQGVQQGDLLKTLLGASAAVPAMGGKGKALEELINSLGKISSMDEVLAKGGRVVLNNGYSIQVPHTLERDTVERAEAAKSARRWGTTHALLSPQGEPVLYGSSVQDLLKRGFDKEDYPHIVDLTTR